MKAAELRTQTVDQLNTELESLLKTHFSLRMQVSMQQLTNTSEIKKVRRSIARVRTLLQEKAVVA